jgi:FkbM family methyltransferase
MTVPRQSPGRLYLLARRAAIVLGLEMPARAMVRAARRSRGRLAVALAPPAAIGAERAPTPSAPAEPQLSDAERNAIARDRLDNANIRLLISFALHSDSNCIDVGAHEGTVLAEILRSAPNGRHIAYEPIPDLAARLRSRFHNVDVREAALSNAEGETTFVYVPEAPAYSGLRERAYPHDVETTTLTVHTERLDEALPPDYHVDFIKIDVEGAEALVLEGALGVIRRDHPIIVFEHGLGGADHYGTTPQRVFELLTAEADLRLFDLDGNGPYSLAQFEDEFARGQRWNYVARP